jgi:hypothetical protein
MPLINGNDYDDRPTPDPDDVPDDDVIDTKD